MTIEIRNMTARDVSKARALISKTMTWTRETYAKGIVADEALAFYIDLRSKPLRANMKNPQHFCYLAFDKEELLGMSLGEYACGVGTIHWIAVDPRYQGRGIGRRLLETTEALFRKKGCHKMTFITYPVLVPAISLYLSCGMVPEAFLRKESFGEDNVIMSKWLPSTKPRKGP